MPKLRTYGFMIREETFCNDPCLVIRVMAREDGAAFPINPRSEGEDAIWDAPKRNDDMMMSDLVARMYASDYGVHRGDFEFLQPYSVGAKEARRMVKTFDAMHRQAKRDDYPTEIGDWIESTAKAINATFWAVDERKDSRSSSYRDGDWFFRSITDLKRELRARYQKMRDEFAVKHPEKVAA